MRTRGFVVGLFVAAGLALFTVGLFLIGNRHEIFARHIDYYAEFTNLAGLAKGAKVQVAGMDAGQVEEVTVPASPTSRFRLRIRVNETLSGLVRRNSVATIGTEGVVGDTFLLIHPGTSASPAAPPLTTIPSREPTDISELLDEGKGVLADVDGTVKNANQLLTSVGGNLNATLTDVKSTIGNVNDVVVDLKQGRGPAGMLLRDDALANNIRQTVANAQQASANLNHVSSQANALLTDVASRKFPQKVDDTLASVQSASTNLDATARQLNQTIAEATGADEQGVSAGMNLRESISNANAATSNMADETEALKHNFFFSGFFRKRGYYNLTHISPDKYRGDRLFTNPANTRAWLTADQLFERNANGTERLTSQGKQLLGGVLAQYGDSIIESPIVVEGYFDGDSADEQLARSRSRAILVRQYLQNHFQIDASHIGIVAMKGIPPPGLQHSSWNGACIVVVKRKG